MKTVKQFILPVVLIIVFSVYLGVKNTGKINYELPAFETVEKNSFRSVEIINGDSTIKLYSDDGVWRFDSDNKKVSTGKIEKITEFLGTPKFLDMVSESTNYQNFGLEKGEYITVRAYISTNKGDKPDREFFIGDLSSNRNFTYIRSSDNSGVFTADSSIRLLFDTTKDDLLDKHITDIDSALVDKIIYTSRGITKTLTKTVGENSKDIWTEKEGTEVDSTKLAQSLRYLSNSGFESYTDIDTPENETDLISLTLTGEGFEETFSIIKKLETGYLGQSTFTGSNFILSDNTGTQLIKMFNDIIESE